MARVAGWRPIEDPPRSASGGPRSRGTPRISNRLLRRVRDYAEVRADGAITLEVARAGLAVYDVDQLGLDRLDRAVLAALVRIPWDDHLSLDRAPRNELRSLRAPTRKAYIALGGRYWDLAQRQQIEQELEAS